MSASPLQGIYKFISFSPRLATAGQPTEEDLHSVAESGFDVVINLALHDDPAYSLHDESNSVRSLGMEYIHIPVQFNKPTETDLFTFFKAYEACRHKKVFIHCAANKRVSVFLALFRILKEGRHPDRALAAMNSVWEPDEIWQKFISTVLGAYHG
jgi:protein tyrosine phosphatase (PTP) superfamily phosphohydrolase (DUF442 family)